MSAHVDGDQHMAAELQPSPVQAQSTQTLESLWLDPAEEFSFENRAHTTIDIVLFGTFAALLSIALRFDLCSLDYATLRFLYSVPAVSLLVYRVVLYFQLDYVLFLLDLCPIAQCLLLWTLWFAYTDGYLER